MKALPFLLLCCLPVIVTAQTTFAPAGTAWVYATNSYWNGSTYPSTLYVTGDTVIHDVTCQRITGEPPMCTYFDILGYPSSMFTRTSGDSVYWYDELSDAFRLFVPFDAVPGSTWKIAVPVSVDPLYYDTAQFVVAGVETVDVDGQPLRRLHVTQEVISGGNVMFFQNTGTFTERMGHDYFMFPWILNCSDADLPAGLICYSDPDMSWPDPGTSCAVWLGVKHALPRNGFKIHPDPVPCSAPISIDVERSVGPQGSIEVIDALGRVRRSEPFAGFHGTMTIAEPGAYLLILRNAGALVGRQRIVVQ